MKSKTALYGLVTILAILMISGCSTTPKKMKEDLTGIKTRVDTLESRVEGVETKQAEVERITSEQAQALEEMKASKEPVMAKSNISVKARDERPSEKIKDIQTALKNAGFYSGNIDGIKGKATRKAIRDFQSANGLKVDGVVGSRTWDALSKYQYAAPAASSGSDEGADIK